MSGRDIVQGVEASWCIEQMRQIVLKEANISKSFLVILELNLVAKSFVCHFQLDLFSSVIYTFLSVSAEVKIQVVVV